MVLDISASGLFVQTNASPAPGTPLRLELRVPGLSEPLEMQAIVARKRIVPPRLRTLLQGGIGIQLENPPEEYFALVAKLQAQITDLHSLDDELRSQTRELDQLTTQVEQIEASQLRHHIQTGVNNGRPKRQSNSIPENFRHINDNLPFNSWCV